MRAHGSLRYSRGLYDLAREAAPGIRPGMASHFLLLAQKKVTKEKGLPFGRAVWPETRGHFWNSSVNRTTEHSSTSLIKPGKDARSATLDALPTTRIAQRT